MKPSPASRSVYWCLGTYLNIIPCVALYCMKMLFMSAVQLIGTKRMFQNSSFSYIRTPLTHPLKIFFSEVLEEYGGKVSMSGRTITNVRVAHEIYALAEGEQEQEALVESVEKTWR